MPERIARWVRTKNSANIPRTHCTYRRRGAKPEMMAGCERLARQHNAGLEQLEAGSGALEASGGISG